MSDVDFNVNAVARKETGKADVRRLRRTGGVPAVIYGGKSDAVSITVRQNEMIRHLEDEAFYSHILNMEVDGESERVILKDVQRHPYRQDIMHVDFLRVVKGQKLTVTVPLHFINENKAPAVAEEGGVLQHVITEVEIEVLPRNLPEYIEVDMGGLSLGDSVHLSDLVMPEGAELMALAHGGDDQTVANAMMPRKEEEPEETEAPEAADVPAANQKDDAEDKSDD